ncbi:hypothetical protein V6N12_016300 [Hibiscus sabdariffa]|uniref:Uncharacterized protein n=1 Tax=Hibiscus sabdariffa TaxID=183260 RepID=A0ABR2CDP0_9ROSI
MFFEIKTSASSSLIDKERVLILNKHKFVCCPANVYALLFIPSWVPIVSRLGFPHGVKLTPKPIGHNNIYLLEWLTPNQIPGKIFFFKSEIVSQQSYCLKN